MGNKGTCKAADCGKDVKAKGYCERHYSQWRKGKMGKPRYKICHAENCRKAITRRGLCQAHFEAQFTKKKAEATAPAVEAPAAS
ncbi:MAG: hypothetical protein HYR72_22710 [Deltaproteobacteria bacterium]|nr:hypothetical protein [Deltaproteobacteria bacterium]MBI3390659.1 hypothetical protein [Deltaproteobacteria bacterium]